MKRYPNALRLLVILVHTVLAISLVWAPRSTATTALYSENDPSSLVTITQEQKDKETKGEIIAQLKFDPKINGFGFENFGNDEREWKNDLDAGDLIKMFGAENVCRKGDNASNCVLNAAGREWLDKQLQGMNGGHCEGMAAASLRFYQGKDFKGKAAPADFQAGARAVLNLKQNGLVENYIAYYFVTQNFDEVSDPTRKTAEKGPAAILDMLTTSMKQGKETYTLGIYKYEKGEKKDGHAITPFAVEDMGEGNYRVHVYDNNYPKETRYVEINKTKQTWNYRTATKPGEPVDEYRGDAKTQTLELTATSLRDPGTYFACPFCDETAEDSHHASIGAQGQKRKVAPEEEVEFALNGEGDILITTAEGKRLGFDFRRNQFVNEISGADVIPFKGGLGKDIPPTYQLPYNERGKPYTVNISGGPLKKEVDADLTMTGPGFAVGFEGIRIDPGEIMTMTMRPDGRQLTFNASQDAETPAIFLAVDPDEDGASYLFEIEGMKLDAGKTVTVTLDTDKGQLFFKDDDGNEDEYDVKMTRINDDGTENVYEEDDLDIGDADSYEMQFGKWDGKGPICFKDDDNGDGFADEECESEDNEATQKKTSFWENIFREASPVMMKSSKV